MDFNEMTLDALNSLRAEKWAALQPMLAPEFRENATDEQVTEANSLADEIRSIDAAIKAKADARSSFEGLADEFTETEEEPVEEEPEADPQPEVEADAEEPVEAAEEQPEPEQPKAGTKGVAALAAKTARPAAPAAKPDSKPVKIVAAHNVPDFATGHQFDDLSAVAEAVINVARGFGEPQGDGRSVSIQKFGTAAFQIDYPEDLLVDERDSASTIDEAMNRAIDESQLPGGSLVAAGGWCAPSETMYDLDNDATMEGMVSLPEIGVRRGGIRFPGSPTFADFYANPGFLQTEAQAIAGTTKPCVEVDCPDFTDVRLDVEGICIKVPILTNVGYPEVVRNFIAGSMTAHAHWINANVIGRLVTAAGAARVFTGLGSTYSDTLEALGLVIDQTRQKYRLGLKATVEVVVPFWVKNAFRADIGRRAGRNAGAVTDAEIATHFGAIGANVQYVYDWQGLTETDEAYPATFQALAYPAGTFVKGTSPVINLNTIYDAASLATNVYTGLFAEQGLLVAQKKFHADLLTLPICNAGVQGALEMTCAVAP